MLDCVTIHMCTLKTGNSTSIGTNKEVLITYRLLFVPPCNALLLIDVKITATRLYVKDDGLLSSSAVQEEFSHPVESLALTVDEVINVRRVLVKAEMEKFLQSKELYNNLKKGKVAAWSGTPLMAVYPVFTVNDSVTVCVLLSGLLLLQSEIPSLLMAVYLPTV